MGKGIRRVTLLRLRDAAALVSDLSASRQVFAAYKPV